jgi:MinD-like ATPase involved in chromosome partitioning or flagellar assembly
MEGTMASDPKEPSVAATDEATPDATHGVPIIPGVPFLPGREVPAADSTETAGAAGSAADDGDADVTAGGRPSLGDEGGVAGAANGTGLPDGLPVLPAQGGPVDGPATQVQSQSGTPGSGPTQQDEAGAGWQPSGSRGARGALPEGVSGQGSAQGRPVERSSRRDKDTGPEPASALTADRLLAGVERAPVSGWRRWLYTVTLGRVNVGDSDAVRGQRALEHRISARLGERTRYVPVLSRKGGVGKTTVTTLLGMALADIREDRIIAMDANPDRGTLSDRSPGRADFTARQLVQNRYTIETFAQLAGYVTRDGSRLHVLASDSDPAVAQAFDDTDYRAVTDVLSRYYSIVLTDSGTGMVHSVMKGTLEKADSVVLVSGGSVDEARLASETLSWLEAHGRQDLLAKAIVVINLSSGNGTQVDVSQIEQHFRSRVKTVLRIPYDRHLAEGSRIELGKLNPATRRAVTELAALVVDQLGS